MAGLEEVITEAIKTALKDAYSAMPAQVVSFNPTTQTADVQPTLKILFKDGDNLTRPIIPNIRVGFQRVGNFAITFPLSKGDEGLLIVADRSIDAWRKQGGIVSPNDARMHDLSDSIFLPMCYSDPKNIASFNASDIAIRSIDNSGKIEIAPDGRIEIDRNGNKVLATLSSALGTLGATTVTITAGSSVGTYPIDQQSTFTALQAVIDAIKK